MKRVKRYLLVLICLLLLNGCVKNDTTMKINSDKSMELEISLTVKDKYKNTLSTNLNPTDIEKQGFKVYTANNGEYSGYKITKKFDNIDELSKGNNEPLEISTMLEENYDFTKLFTKKTDFFKETYTANYKYSVTELRKKYTKYGEDDELFDEDDSDSVNDFNELELTYILVLPSKAKTNDASETTKGGKNLVWKLSPTTDSKINYTFVIYNYKHIALVGGGALLLVIIIIVLIVLLKKKKESTSSLIYKEYDPSIEGQLNKNEIIQDDPNKQTVFVQEEVKEETKKPESLEFGLPEEQTANHVSTAAPLNQFVEGDKPVEEKPKEEFVIPQVNSSPIPEMPKQPEIPQMMKMPDFAPTLEENRNLEIKEETPEAIETPKVMQTPEVNEKPKMIQTPDFAPTLEEKQTEAQVKPNTFDYNGTPDFVRQNDSHMFIDEQNDKAPVVPPQETHSAPELDIPNATALSDMPEYK